MIADKRLAIDPHPRPLALRARGEKLHTIGWALAALIVGAALAVLPMRMAVGLLAVAVLCVLSLIDIRVALVITLIVAPLKILVETEFAPARELPIDIGQIALFATFGIWLARRIAARRRLNLTWTPMYVPLLLFLLAASLSLWNSAQPWSTLKELVLWIEMLAMVALVVALMHESGGTIEIGWLVGGLIAAGCVQAVIGIYEFRGGSGAPHLWILEYRYFRAFGSFGQPNPFGAFMGLILSMSLGATFGAATQGWTTYRTASHPPNPSPFPHASGGKGSKIRDKQYSALPKDTGKARTWAVYTILLLGADVLLGAGLLVSWSRGAQIGFGAGALTLVFFAPKRRLIGVGLVGVMILGLGISIITGLAPVSIVNRLSDFSQEIGSYDDVRGVQISDANYAVVERIAHWQAAVAMATDNPWLGVGFGAYETAYPRYALLNWPMALGHAHNYYLNVLAETGIVGLSAYLVTWLLIVVFTLRVLRREIGFNRGVALGILAAWADFAVHSFFDKLYVNNMFLHLGVMLGLIGGLLIYRRCIQVKASQGN